MNIYKIVTAFLLFVGFRSDGQEVLNNLLSSDKIDKNQLELIFENCNQFPDHFQASIAFIKEGKTYFYGIKKENDTISSVVNKDSIFEIGSISKVFTATLFAKYVKQGIIRQDEYINEYFPFAIKDDVKITFKQLANHTSGLPRIPTDLFLYAMGNPSNPYLNYTDEALTKYLSETVKFTNNPGEKYDYSNLGMGFLGYILSQIQKKDYESMLKEQIFSEYSMENSTSIRSKIEKGLIKGVDVNGNETSNWDFASLVGAGGILSSTSDLSKFVNAQFLPNQDALELTREKTFEVNEKMDIALGWHILHRPEGINLFWHNGATGGYTSSLAFDFENKTAIIILTNITAFDPNSKNIDKLCFDLMKTLE